MEHLRECAKLVEREIEKWLPPDTEPESLTKASRHSLKAGKRLRPCLALTSCEAVGGKKEDILEAAAALEFLHNFTLIHDDIMDRDEFRRNLKTVHAVWGEPLAIIAGDALFSKVFEAVGANVKRLSLSPERATEVLETISGASFEICQGQAVDMSFEGRADVSESEYFEMINKKTGALMGASAKVGALLGQGKLEEVNSLAEYGRLIGMAFQIYDDVLGLIGKEEKFGKAIGSDLRAGKQTLVIQRALRVAENREKLSRVIRNRQTSDAEVREAIQILRESGAIDYAVSKARELIAEAKSKLNALPDSKSKELLLELADFTIGREF